MNASKKILSAGIIGCGGIHHNHVSALQSVENGTLRAVCDIKPQKAQASADCYGVKAYTDYHDLLADPSIDVVHITLPHYLHAPVAIDALKAGKYVLCEKPMATSVENARAMLAASDAVGGKLGIIFQNRYNVASRKMKELIEGGTMGKLLCLRGMVNWYRSDAYYSDDWHGQKALEGGGVMMNQAIHTLDLMQWMADADAVTVYGMTGIANHSIEVEDMASFRVEFANGVPGIFHATVSYGIDADVELEAVLEKGQLLLRANSLYRLNEEGMLEPLEDKAADAVDGKAYWGTGHLAQIQDFYRSVGNGEPITIDGRQGFRAFAIVQALYVSAQTHAPATVAQAK